MIVQEKKKLIPKEQQKLGTSMNGKDSIALFLAESIGTTYNNGKIDFGQNKELLSILNIENK